MIDSLEVKYLSITWASEDKVSQLKESRDSVEIQQAEDGSYFIETTAFPKVYHYVGIHIIDDQNDYEPPYFELSEGGKEQLAVVRSPGDGKKWWVQKTRWNKKNNCFDSEIFRSVGTATLGVKSKKLTIINNYMDFTADELNYYLQDFKNNLWELILDNSNPVKGSIEGSSPNFFKEETLQLYSEFLKVVRKVVDNPNMFLSEKQSKLPIKKARPVASTFRELATNPQRKEVSSRDFYESYNTAENKYINFCVRRIAYLLRSFDRLSKQRASEFKNNIDHQLKIKQELLSTREFTISNKVLLNEVKTIKEQIDELEGLKINRKECDPSLSPHKLTNYKFELLLGKPYGKKKGCYFIQAVNGIDIKDYLKSVKQHSCTYAVINFDAKDNFDVGKIDLAYMTVQIEGYGLDEIKKNSKNKDFTDVSLKVITHLDFDIKQHRLYQNLESRKEQLDKLSGKDLKRQLSSVERREIQEECRVIDKKVELLKKTRVEVEKFASHLPSIKSQIKYIIDFFEKNRVGISHVFPNSMVFIQNPNYAGAKSLFKKIVDLNGLDLDLLEDMMTVDEIGLTNISNLYERWCLIKVIKVLNEVYGFSLNEGWQQSLISSVLTNKYNNASINMYSKRTHQSITVFYEKEIVLSKKNEQGIVQTRHIRPDIVVDVSMPKLAVQYRPRRRDSILKSVGVKTSRLVLDAKFKDLNEYSHQELIKSLYFGKNYSQDGNNKVFIIHPTPYVIENPTSPLSWGMFCDYGQTGKYPEFKNIKGPQAFDNDSNVNTNKHRLGGVFLAPSLRHTSSKDNLQRLIGMFLQENSQRHYCDRTDTKWHTMTCISCGNTDRSKLTLSYDKTQGDNDKWELRCDKCKQRTVQTVCVKCGYEIFKNGMKWTYHRTKAEQFTNVVCPNCESFL